MKHLFHLNFYLKSEKSRKDGTAPIYARITVQGQRAEIAIQRWIAPADWDANKSRPKGRDQVQREIATYLHTVQARLYQYHRELIDRHGNDFTARDLKNAYLGVGEQGKTLLEVFDQHNARMQTLVGQDYAPGTYQRYLTTRKHVAEFLQHAYQRKDIPLQRLGPSFLEDLDYYFRSVRQCGNNSTVKYIKNLRKIILIAIRNEWLDKDPFRNYDGKLKTVDRPFLTEEELQAIIDKELPVGRLSRVRDIFVFACYTGIAYVDVAHLSKANLFRQVDGSYWIQLHRRKTDVRATIPLLPQARAILDRYADDPEAQSRGTLLPASSNQKTNAYLKEIAALCGIDKPLTFHIARHTFATTVTLANGVPIETVSAMLGHTDIKTTQHYAKIVQRKVGEDMQALQERLAAKAERRETAIIRKHRTG